MFSFLSHSGTRTYCATFTRDACCAERLHIQVKEPKITFIYLNRLGFHEIYLSQLTEQPDTSQFHPSLITSGVMRPFQHRRQHIFTTDNKGCNFLLSPLIKAVVALPLFWVGALKLAGPENVLKTKDRGEIKATGKTGCLAWDYKRSHSGVSHVVSVVAKGHLTALYSKSPERKTEGGLSPDRGNLPKR